MGLRRRAGSYAKTLWAAGSFRMRHVRRTRNWAKGYVQFIEGERPAPPLPTHVQVAVTERCNLRCLHCNQWGPDGYYLSGARPVGSMPIDGLLGFLEDYTLHCPDLLLNVYGGEPFVYKHMGVLLDHLHAYPRDVVFTTNGMHLSRFAEQLARINSRTMYMLSIDGGPETHNLIRGHGVTERIYSEMRELRRACLEISGSAPKILLNFTLSEHNAEAIDEIDDVARALSAQVVNFAFRGFTPLADGQAYDAMLRSEFGVEPTGAWRAELNKPSHPALRRALARIHEKTEQSRRWPFPPVFVSTPTALSSSQMQAWFSDYHDTFGIQGCVMPAYWARIQSNGDVVHCLGHPDIATGNVFEQSLADICQSALAKQFQRKVEDELLPVCHRCCGLYITSDVTRHVQRGFYPLKGAPRQS